MIADRLNTPPLSSVFFISSIIWICNLFMSVNFPGSKSPQCSCTLLSTLYYLYYMNLHSQKLKVWHQCFHSLVAVGSLGHQHVSVTTVPPSQQQIFWRKIFNRLYCKKKTQQNFIHHQRVQIYDALISTSIFV